MTSPSLTLAQFLHARLDDAEADARTASAATSGPWRVGADESPWTSNSCMLFDSNGPMWQNEDSASMSLPKGVARHIARHDPARVLADVESRRRIVQWLHHQPETGIRHGDEEYVSCACGWDQVLLGVYDWDDAYRIHLAERGVDERMAETMLRLLALPYAEHPDCRQEWAP